LGFAAYGASARWIRQVLYEVRPSDPVALGSALLLIATTAVLAAAPPIWRAVRINPASALRQE
jgi:ABC-type lipoprotein release transport system permease subunit